jgi:hypothetical protein
MIAKVIAAQGGHVEADDPTFLATCTDVLGCDSFKVKRDGVSVAREEVLRLIKTHCDSKGRHKPARAMRAS